MTMLEGVTLAIAVLAPAAAAVASYATIRERVGRHDRSIENFGERLNKLERAAEVVDHELSRPYRIPGAVPTGEKP